jgi:hypothetical protein
MSWRAVLEVVERELGHEVAAAIDRVVRRELRGLRLTIPSRATLTPDIVHEAAPYQPRKAARILDIHPSTVYRLLRVRRSLIR